MFQRKLTVLGIFVLAFGASACTSKPELSQVPASAKAQAINSTESTKALREKYEN